MDGDEVGEGNITMRYVTMVGDERLWVGRWDGKVMLDLSLLDLWRCGENE